MSIVMQVTTPVMSQTSYLSTIPGSSTFTAVSSPDGTFQLPSMRRVISTPSRQNFQLRDAAPCTMTPTVRCLSHHAMAEDSDANEEHLPAFMREEYFTRQAMKQMAEHRLLLDACKARPVREAEEDEYAWYFKNPQRYVWRPRDRRAAQAQAQARAGLRSGERDADMNRSLFASYLVRHYGSAVSCPNSERGSGSAPSSPRGRAAVDARASSASRTGSEGPGGSDASTLFWVDEWDLRSASSPTVGSTSLQAGKRASGDELYLPPRTASELSVPAALPGSPAKNSNKKRWSTTSAPLEGKKASSRGGSTRSARGAGHRRFSIFHLFSAA